MYVNVVFPIAHRSGFVYRVPPDLESQVNRGVRVKAYLKKSLKIGYVIDIVKDIPEDLSLKIKDIVSVIDSEPILPEVLLNLVIWASDYYCEPVGIMFKSALAPYIREGKIVPDKRSKKWIRLKKEFNETESVIKTTKRQRDLVELVNSFGEIEVNRVVSEWGFSRSVIKALVDKGVLEEFEKDVVNTHLVSEDIRLTRDQVRAIESIELSLGRFERFLLFGVTASGKTEVYKRICAKVVNSGGKALVLVPEISLTPHYVKRFYNVFGDSLCVLHSGLSPAERAREWMRIRKGKFNVVIGTRSAIFAPYDGFGIIIVDEEHDISYKQQETPRYNARDLAVVRAKFENCPVVLGSATPSVESYYNAVAGKYKLVTMKERVGGTGMPDVVLVDMKKEKSIVSDMLKEEISSRLQKAERVLVLHNRKGFSRTVVCKSCGLSVMCPNCEVSLVVHRLDGTFFYVCHWCGYTKKAFSICPSCKKETLYMMGYGLQRVVDVLKKLFPEANIERIDSTVVRSKYSLFKVLDELESGRLDILVGTQIIAKGHHFPSVTLSCIIMADYGLNIPDFRSSERVFQLISQMAGRAGRGSNPGKVVVQAVNISHYSIRLGAKSDYEKFFEEEIEKRKLYKLPPVAYMARVIFSGKDEDKVKSVADNVVSSINSSIDIMGPAPCGIRKIKNRYRWHIIMKSDKRKTLKSVLKDIPRAVGSVRIFVDVDPYEFI